jgi:glycosyltransferase involved in cell wall biosynthesis
VRRILFLTTEFAWPPSTGGRIGTMSQLQVLSSLPEVERIRFFAMHETDVRVEHRDALLREVPKLEWVEPVFHPIHLFRYPRYVPRVVWLRAIHGVPYVLGKWDSPAVREGLRRELVDGEFDVVWLDGLGIAHYLPLVRTLQPAARVVLRQFNVESDLFAQFARRQRGLARLVAEAEWRAARRYERDTLRAVDAVGVVSADDVATCRQLASVEALNVPHLVPFTRRAASPDPGPRFCWVGGLTWDSNARGLDWFCTEVWPRIRENLPEATFEIVGSGLRTDRHGAVVAPAPWRRPGVTTLGFVDDVAAVYERSAALVAPIRGGTGIRVKLLEAFRHGVPVVTTPDGAAGLPIESGREAFVEAEAHAFADRAVELATSGGLRHRLRDAGYAFLERHNGLPETQAVIRSLLGSAPAPDHMSEPRAQKNRAPDASASGPRGRKAPASGRAAAMPLRKY